MKWCRYTHEGQTGYGLVQDDSIQPLAGGLFDPPRPAGAPLPCSAVQWLPPVVPGTFYAVGLNYRSHIEHARQHGMPGAQIPNRPEIGYRANNALTGHLQPIMRPRGVHGRFEAEAELVAVIGRKLRRCSRDEARAAIFGWTIGNDVSARQWQHSDRTFWRSKNSDTFKPMGPWIDTGADAMNATTLVSVNGERRLSFPTGAMVFDPCDYIVEMSKYLTLHPGDVLWMGADGTTQMEPGDTIDIEITGLGTLRNYVVLDADGLDEEDRP
ncbi:Homoprotocatechuate catabolism bifunctional isomerase/decarboxylase [Pigmentiphaga humi]|uniref:Homoprotocatechuate catabolism bifunctional isomerase/decarboxylase n=1 Tax=Pigmentiphaga humi TaxID=2478468 RepID=A0A3P4B2Y6_9BURK|nr:fumarylacetoacetate hydrolase family protein [Pigmentiphaga humi]VCU70422.1 Homoprotocatechuate catabolism bifunctional isomerase/decarboxylase [Pigmentiphaga humi]